jgi:IclR family KDG regulon transcriptional repressor
MQTSSRNNDLSIYTVPAVDRAVRILLMLSDGTQGMTLAEIAAATGWHKSSVHKILITLDSHGFLERDESTKRYSPGIELMRCGQSLLKSMQANHSAKIFLKELADYSGETATLAVVRGKRIVIVEVVESRGELRATPPLGTMDSITAKSNGKAVLAWLPQEKVREILKTEGLPAKTKNSITKMQPFFRELAAVRNQGYAIDVEEFQEGISAVSAPVFNPEGRVLGTLSVIGPAFRMTKKNLHLYGRKCVETAALMTPAIR